MLYKLHSKENATSQLWRLHIIQNKKLIMSIIVTKIAFIKSSQFVFYAIMPHLLLNTEIKNQTLNNSILGSIVKSLSIKGDKKIHIIHKQPSSYKSTLLSQMAIHLVSNTDFLYNNKP
jgi:hypothetical protein